MNVILGLKLNTFYWSLGAFLLSGGGGVVDQILDGDGHRGFKTITVPYTNFSKMYTRLYTNFSKIYTRRYTNFPNSIYDLIPIANIAKSIPFLIPIPKS